MLWICLAAVLLALGAGGVAGWCHQKWTREVAQRGEQEQRTGEAEARYETLLRELPLGAARLEESGRLRGANSALYRMLKRAPNTLEGIALTDLTHLDDLKELNREPARQEWRGVEGRLVRSDGASFWSRIWRRDSDEGTLLLLEDIGTSRDLEREVKATRRAMDDLYEAVAADNLPFEKRLQALLELGCRRFGLETGVVGKLEGGKMYILSAVSPDGMIRPGDTFDAPGLDAPKSRTGNSTANGSKAALNGSGGKGTASENPNDFDWRDHPVHVASGSETFLGAPMLVDGQLYGTLYFSSRMGRPAGFSPSEVQWVKLMAQWAGGELERREAHAALEAKTTELEAANTRLEALATHDGLTGVKNRRAFNEQLQTEWARARRYGTPLSLILLDVDKFKQYNDSFGHPAGDEVLKQVAQLLQNGIRSIDFLARYGGEEFAVLLPNTPAAGAVILADRLRVRIEKAEWPHREVTISVGISSLHEDMPDAANLTSCADEALYASKANGRNRVTHYRDLQREAAAKDAEVAAKDALDAGNATSGENTTPAVPEAPAEAPTPETPVANATITE